MITAGELLRQARRRSGLSQRALARRARVPQPTIASIERGRQDPRYRTLSRLVRSCGFRLDFLPTGDTGVDRSLIREQLKLTPGQRLRQVRREAGWLAALDRARLQKRGG